ncbi:hypothetical protein bthur0001_54470 [Bacillus thuringiensis serovar tochigiensis BGSC 4Y1]|nr:hypothetical protein bthur0001_54470 [Bacillus thuringiensis serovar tochigiensis BGSC 4Y1]
MHTSKLQGLQNNQSNEYEAWHIHRKNKSIGENILFLNEFKIII